MLAGHFAVSVCGFAVMGNHLHLLVRLDPATADAWSSGSWCPPCTSSNCEILCGFDAPELCTEVSFLSVPEKIRMKLIFATNGSMRVLNTCATSGLSADAEAGAEYVAIYPNVLVGVQCDHFWCIHIEAVAPDRSDEHLEIYYIGDGADDAALTEARAETLTRWAQIMDEDIMIIERLQQGRHSPGRNGQRSGGESYQNPAPRFDRSNQGEGPGIQFPSWNAANGLPIRRSDCRSPVIRPEQFWE